MKTSSSVNSARVFASHSPPAENPSLPPTPAKLSTSTIPAHSANSTCVAPLPSCNHTQRDTLPSSPQNPAPAYSPYCCVCTPQPAHLQKMRHWSMLRLSRMRLSRRCFKILTAWLIASGVVTLGPMASCTWMLSVYTCRVCGYVQRVCAYHIYVVQEGHAHSVGLLVSYTCRVRVHLHTSCMMRRVACVCQPHSVCVTCPSDKGAHHTVLLSACARPPPALCSPLLQGACK